MRKSATNDDVLSTREAAERLGVALRTVQLWVESGVLPAWKTAGGHRRISRAAVEKLIDQRRSALAGEPLPAAGAEPRVRMLVVEDDPDMLRLYRLMIEGWELPLDVDIATNGFEALVRIGERCPDILITDLSMPGMDGVRMIASLRAAGRGYEQMEIIAVTALDAAEIDRRGGLPSSVRVFTKPVAFDELEALVRDRVAAPA